MIIIIALTAFLMIGFQATEKPRNPETFECFKRDDCGQHRPKLPAAKIAERIADKK